LKGEYTESSESFSANENNVASSPNLEDMHKKEVLPIGHSNWHGNEYKLLDPKGIFLVKSCVMAYNLNDAILDDILGHDHVSLTIIYSPRNISMIMIIWKWPLA
jgi:hypothetical protein